MKNNQPVSNTEYVIPDGVFIYSRTDLKGMITDANPAFAEISGFLVEEMIGQPHNMVRHPDMPPAAFEDMWRNLKAGKPWKGLVKNRRKNGDYYWVVANASPVRESGQVVGYQSVRTKPTREQIESAEKAYRRIREGDKSIRIEDGRVIKNRSSLVEASISHEARLYGFIIFAFLTEFTGLLSDHGIVPWLEPVHQSMSPLMMVMALYMTFIYLPKALGRLKRIRDYLDRTLTSGDLTENLVPSQNDLIGSISGRIDTQLSAVRATIQVISDTAREVMESAGSLQSSVSRLATAADQQSATSSAAAAGVEEMTVSIGEVAHHADTTQQVAEVAGQKALDGAALSEKATATIQELSATVSASAGTVEQLGQRTEEVGKVAAVIKDIADQTNLLALNAAIEAARAGEQGRGFAVVADEVRKLAERTSQATQEIDNMIDHIQGDTDTAVAGMRRSAEQVGLSVDLVQEAEASLRSINDEMRKTLEMVSEISHSSAEQSSAMQVMAKSVEQVANLTGENLAIANQTNVVADELQHSVEKMKKAVNQYRV